MAQGVQLALSGELKQWDGRGIGGTLKTEGIYVYT